MTGRAPRIAYADCPSGAAGDMLLGALIDGGWSLEALEAVVDALGLSSAVDVSAERVMRGAIAATRVVVTPREPDPPHRHLPEIEQRIAAGALPEEVRARATSVFRRLAAAEARVHGGRPEDVHFHEVGALDALVDIVGACAGLAALGVTELFASPLALGGGWTTSAHGRIPVPAPATLFLLADAGATTVPHPAGAAAGELVTPTGAALLAEWATWSRPAMALERIGVGAGSRDPDWPNVLRLWLGRPLPPPAIAVEDGLVLLETNVDDMGGELAGHAMERLLDLGALDVTLAPVQMKKNRPGTLLSALVPAALEDAAARLILSETTTLGVRARPVRRHVAARSVVEVETPYGALPVKVKRDGQRVIGLAPEYEACRAAARAHGVPLPVVYAAAAGAAARTEGGAP